MITTTMMRIKMTYSCFSCISHCFLQFLQVFHCWCCNCVERLIHCSCYSMLVQSSETMLTGLHKPFINSFCLQLFYVFVQITDSQVNIF